MSVDMQNSMTASALVAAGDSTVNEEDRFAHREGQISRSTLINSSVPKDDLADLFDSGVAQVATVLSSKDQSESLPVVISKDTNINRTLTNSSFPSELDSVRRLIVSSPLQNSPVG